MLINPLGALLIALGFAAWLTQRGEGGSGGGGHEADLLHHASAGFRAFRDNYILVFATAMAGDWLQGPYIYCLYEFYGYGVGPIGRLFIAGFGSSMLFGTLAGVLADKYGRRRASLAYCFTYIASCLTKHSGSFAVLLVGRLLGGVSTSLLFSSFEAWLVAEHTRRGYDEALLGHVFARAAYVGAGLMAIMSGLLGDVLVEKLGLGPVAPFDAAVVVLLLTAAIVAASWPENFGGQSHDSVVDRLGAGIATICSDRRIALLGALQAMYEGVLYTFVFLWTPSLSSQGEKVPHGLVFSCFMAASMVGSALAGRLMARMRPQQYMAWVYLASLASMAVPFAVNCLPGRQGQHAVEGHHAHASGGSPAGTPAASGASSELSSAPGPGLGLSGYAQVLAFCVFELCLGIFWPSMMTLRAQLVPEAMRSTIINCFRIPLNLFVCVALFKVSHSSLSSMFGLCMALLAACAACQLWLNVELRARPNGSPKAHGAAHSHS